MRVLFTTLVISSKYVKLIFELTPILLKFRQIGCSNIVFRSSINIIIRVITDYGVFKGRVNNINNTADVAQFLLHHNQLDILNQ